MTSKKAAPAEETTLVTEDYKTIQVVFRTARRGQQTPSAAVQTVLFTDQTPQAALASLAGYYQESELLATPKTLDLLVSAGDDADYAFFYFTPENVQVVMDNDTFAGLVQLHGDSIKGAVDFLALQSATILGEAQRNTIEDFSRIQRLDFATQE